MDTHETNEELRGQSTIGVQPEETNAISQSVQLVAEGKVSEATQVENLTDENNINKNLFDKIFYWLAWIRNMLAFLGFFALKILFIIYFIFYRKNCFIPSLVTALLVFLLSIWSLIYTNLVGALPTKTSLKCYKYFCNRSKQRCCVSKLFYSTIYDLGYCLIPCIVVFGFVWTYLIRLDEYFPCAIAQGFD